MLWLDDPLAAVAALPVFALPLFILASAALEYIVPPYWGDMFVLLGFFVAGQGLAPPWLIFVAAFLGSGAGAMVAYALGRRFGLRIAQKVTFRRQARARDRLHRLLERFGEKLLLVNRFVPIIRGLLLYGAGALELRPGRTLIYSSVSNLAWLGILMSVGLYTAETWEGILATFTRYNRIFGSVAIVLVALWAALWWRRWRAQERSLQEERLQEPNDVVEPA